ncbi:MAG: carboxypeptidase-like regulatory domain-containing protein [Candidatus Altarchaeum sp.]|nr:carboxypeptidase-like regulatory domain-containing protein [Candidatus Altarchaeum sp.]
MSKGKIFQSKFLTLGLTAIIAISVLFIGMSEVSASLNIKNINFIGSNADLKINVTIENTYTNSVTFNLTLKDTSNDDEDKEVIYSGQMTIDGNRTQSYIFGKYNYDYPLNSYWENFRCGKHTIQAKITIGGSTQNTKTEDIDLSADNFDLTFFPDIETDKISQTTIIYITVKGTDGKGIKYAKVIITDGDTKKERTTDSNGKTDFKISDLFSSASTGTYTLKISKNEVVKEHYYCNYEKEFQVKKKLNISSIVPANPKVNERITLTLDTDNYYMGIWLTVEGPKPQYHTLTDKTYYFTLDTIGTYKISVSKGIDYWNDEKTITVEENLELKISSGDIVLGKENEFIVLDANDAKVSGAKVTLNGENLNSYKTSDYNGVVKFIITNSGSYEITAEKINYKTGQKTFTAMKKFKIAYEPEKPKIYEGVKIKLLDENDSPVDGTITIDNVPHSTQAGYITYNFTKFVSYKIVGKSQNFADVEVNLKPLKILSLNINKAENEEFSVGENLNITLEGDGISTTKIEIKNLNTNTTTSTTISIKNYTLQLLSPGNYEITTTAPGFGDVRKTFSVRHLTMKINAKYDDKNNKILISATSEGKGLENAIISVKTPKNLVGQYITDANGEAVFDAVCGEGNYTVSVEKIHYETRQQIVEVKKQIFDFGVILHVAIIIIVLLVVALIYLILKKKRANKVNI